MIDKTTQAVAAYVREKGIQVSTLSEATRISYSVLQPSLSGKRKLRADEFLKICEFLEVEPKRFWQKSA